MVQFIIHIAYDGTTTFKHPDTGRVVAYAGAAEFIAEIVKSMGWQAYGSPTNPTGDFIAVAPKVAPEDLSLDVGEEGWLRMTADEVLDFANDMDASGNHR